MNTIAKIFVLGILLVSCQNRGELIAEKPADVLTQETMVSIMTDIHIVEGAKVGRKIMGDTLNIDSYYNKIYDKHGTEKEIFEKSFTYYTENPKLMDQIFEKVIEKLNAIEFDAPEGSRVPDTIQIPDDALEKVDQ